MYCPNCKQSYEGKFCPECGTKLIEEPQASGISINLGDANAISGGINITDSHNVYNTDNSVHNVHNVVNTTTQITNVEAQKTKEQIELERANRKAFQEACELLCTGSTFSQESLVELEELRLELGMSEREAKGIIDSITNLKAQQAKTASLTGLAKIQFKSMVNAVNTNNRQQIAANLIQYTTLADNHNDDDVQYYFSLILALANPKLLADRMATADENYKSYWMEYWSYFANLMTQNRPAASAILATLHSRYGGRFPESNMILLAAVDEYLKGNKEEALSLYNEKTGDVSDILVNFDKAFVSLLHGYVNEQENTAIYTALLSQDYPVLKQQTTYSIRNLKIWDSWNTKVLCPLVEGAINSSKARHSHGYAERYTSDRYEIQNAFCVPNDVIVSEIPLNVAKDIIEVCKKYIMKHECQIEFLVDGLSEPAAAKNELNESIQKIMDTAAEIETVGQKIKELLEIINPVDKEKRQLYQIMRSDPTKENEDAYEQKNSKYKALMNELREYMRIQRELEESCR